MTNQTHFSEDSIARTLSLVTKQDARPFILVLDGPGGSGKSTLARELAAAWSGTVAIVQGDDFYADLDDEYRASLDAEGGYQEYFDWRRLRDQVFQPARAGEVVTYQRYDWDHGRMGDWVTVPDVDMLIVEGVRCARPELREYADTVVWVNTSERERLHRQIARGENEDVWIQRWMAAENYYREHVHQPGSDDIEITGE